MKLSWIKNSEGKPDAMLTLTVIVLAVVLIKVIFGGMSVHIYSWTMNVDPISPELAGVLLGPNIGAYVARRYTDRKFPKDDQKRDDLSPEDPQSEDEQA